MTDFSLECITPEATTAFAAKVAGLCRKGDCITLSGDLGSGKTTFAQGLIRELAGEDTEVTSPTFNLIQSYAVALADGSDCELFHADLYRLQTPEEAEEVGLDEAVEDGVLIVEWPLVGEHLLPETCLKLTFSHKNTGNTRVIVGKTDAEWYSRLVTAGIIA